MSRLVLRRRLKPVEPPPPAPTLPAKKSKRKPVATGDDYIMIRKTPWYTCQFCEVHEGKIFLVDINDTMMRFRKVDGVAYRDSTSIPLGGGVGVFARWGDFDA